MELLATLGYRLQPLQELLVRYDWLCPTSLISMTWSRFKQHRGDMMQQTLLPVKHFLYVSEILLVLDLVGVRLAQQRMIDDFQMVLPFLGRQQVHTVEVLEVVEQVGRLKPGGLETLPHEHFKDHVHVAHVGNPAINLLLDQLFATKVH